MCFKTRRVRTRDFMVDISFYAKSHHRIFKMKQMTSLKIHIYFPDMTILALKILMTLEFSEKWGDFGWFSLHVTSYRIFHSPNYYTVFSISILYVATIGEIQLKSPQFSENPSDVRVFKANVVTFGKYSSPPTYAIIVSSKNIAQVEIAQLGGCFMQ